MSKRFIKENRFSRARGRQAVVCVSVTRISRAMARRWRAAWQRICGAARLGMLAVTVFLMAVLGIGCRSDGSAVVIHGTVTESESAWEAMSDQVLAQGGETVADDMLPWPAVTEPATSAAMIYVHICGQVSRPGVYALAEGSRVWDAVEAAGGFTEAADPEAVNLAMTVADGSKVTIPTRAEAQDSAFSWYETGSGAGGSAGSTITQTGQGTGGLNMGDVSAASGLVDINRADVTRLMTIPGIGQVRAEAIVSHREVHGPFETIEEIMQVTGIKEGLFEKIRDYITVGG